MIDVKLSGQKNIRKRMFLLLLSVGILSFIAFGIVSFMSMNDVREKVVQSGEMMGESAAGFTENFAVEQAKERLLAIAKEKAEIIERVVGETRSDAEYLAMNTTRMLEHPEKYAPRTIQTPFGRSVKSEEAVIYYAPAIREQGISPELEREIGIVGNIADDVEIMAHFYRGYSATCIIGSKEGYTIFADVMPDGSDEVLPEDFLATYDHRIRPWYIDAEKAGEAVITDVYADGGGTLSITCAHPYFKNGEFAGVAAIGNSWESLYNQAMQNNSDMQETDITIILNSKGDVMMSSAHEGILSVSEDHYISRENAKDLRQYHESSLAAEAVKMTEGKSGVALVTVDGKEYYLAYAPMPAMNWSFGTLIARDKVIEPATYAKTTILAQTENLSASMNSFFLRNLINVLFLLFILAAVIFVISEKVSGRVVRPILALADGVKSIAQGNLDQKLNIKTGDEIEHLANCVNSMTDELKEYMENLSKVTAEKERISTELNVATSIQKGMLPSVSPDFVGMKGIELYAGMNPAKEVGGDFYDFYMLDEKHLAVTIADVSGKGIPAALFMVVSKTVLKNFAMTAASEYMSDGEPDFAAVIERANRQLCENNEEMMFVTVFFGVLNVENGEFVYVNGGHNPPLVISDTGSRYIKDQKNCHMLGVNENAKYNAHRLMLDKGDVLFLYTDGVTEAMDEDGQMYSDERLQMTLDSIERDASSVEDILKAVREDVALHAADAEQSDDITMLGLRYRGS